MGQMLASRILARPSGSLEGGVTASEAASLCKLFLRIAGTFAGAGIVLYLARL